ncbi:MAG: SHOCT domain-containing protein [Halobacteriota archaeon]
MARGRGLMLVAGMRAGEARAQKSAAQQAELNEAQQQAAAAQQQAAAPPASTDSTAELKKLADLHASGILTDEEFAAAKKKALGI